MPAAQPQPRRKVLAELDARIARAEAVRAGHLADLTAHPDIRHARIMLDRVDEQLAMLRRSREALLGGGG